MKEVTIVSFYWIDTDRFDGWVDLDAHKEIEHYVYTEAILVQFLKECIQVTSSITVTECLSPLRVPYSAIKDGKKGIKKRKVKINLNIT